MIELIAQGVYLLNGQTLVKSDEAVDCGQSDCTRAGLRRQTISYQILAAHNTSNTEQLALNFDCLASHDITYVGIIQTARASGLTEFPLPYVLTNCHNSLCAVGGTINEDDHIFGLTAARKYGGIYVPAHQAVIHQYMRETMAGCGKMILGSDSHTRYGALGTLAIGEGGGELVKQLLGKPYELDAPEVVAVYLTGKPQPGVGPQDVALALIQAVFDNGFIKNKILEFIGPGIAGLSVDFRNGIDVMTTETACLSSIWQTDDVVRDYYKIHGRIADYRQLTPGLNAYYDAAIKIDLNRIQSMIALPFHPSNAWTITEFKQNAADILRQVEVMGQALLASSTVQFKLTDKLINGQLKVDQGIVAGCAGGSFENILRLAQLIADHPLGNGEFSLSIYPASQPINMALVKSGLAATLLASGATIRTAFCGPCFGAGEVPAHNALSIRHTTRNFPNREGSKPTEGQIAGVALMDARSIAATTVRDGILTAGTDFDWPEATIEYNFDSRSYAGRVYQGFGKPQSDTMLLCGPNIVDWPCIRPLPAHLLLQVSAVLTDPITTTDELIPSGETASFRSNPLRLAEFTLSRKDPRYVARAKACQALEVDRQTVRTTAALKALFAPISSFDLTSEQQITSTGIGSVIVAQRPGDGSAREQAASCQRILGGDANIAIAYATKRYRSNLINWGLIPFTVDPLTIALFEVGDTIYLPNIREAIVAGCETVSATLIRNQAICCSVTLKLPNLSFREREIIVAGCLINYYA